MPDQIITLPFTVPDLLVGFAEGRGLVRLGPSDLVLEFVVKDSLVGVFKSGIKEIRIPRSEVDVVRLKRGLFGAKVSIRVKSMKWFADMPGGDKGEVAMHVGRRDRGQAATFVQMLAGVQR